MNFSVKQQIIFVLLCLLIFQVSLGQCSMCKATAESSLGSGNSIAGAINYGIIYMIPIPYIILFVLGYIWYKNNKKANV